MAKTIMNGGEINRMDVRTAGLIEWNPFYSVTMDLLVIGTVPILFLHLTSPASIWSASHMILNMAAHCKFISIKDSLISYIHCPHCHFLLKLNCLFILQQAGLFMAIEKGSIILYRSERVHSLPNHKFLDKSKLKAFADKINVT